MPGMVPRVMCKPVPQIALAVMAMTASAGCSNVGSGMSSNLTIATR
jgi:hypothetical protein